MAEHLSVSLSSKKEKYEILLPQINSLIGGEKNRIANLSNISAALKQTFDFFWVGFYIVEGSELVLGPFQGPIACTRIQFGKGVCGRAWELKKEMNIPNVEEFSGHIACSAETKSELVVPIVKENKVLAVLDIDSNKISDFDQTDIVKLKELCACIADLCF
jgi:L-methionine (R)-S-oxide reductase